MNLRPPRILPLAAAILLSLSTMASPFGQVPVQADSSISISGNVVGAAGNLGGVAVSACATDWGSCAAPTQTDNAGHFSFEGVQPGLYLVTFQPGPHYLWGYYQGPGLTQDVGSATPVDATGGSATLTNVQLPAADVISGTVTGADGALRLIEPTACDAAGNCTTSQADEAGNYTIGGLAPGAYTLQFLDDTESALNADLHPYVSGYYTGSGLSPDRGAALPITLTDGDVTLPNLNLQIGAVLSGTVSGAAGNLGTIQITACPAGMIGACVSAMTDDRGNYAIRGLWPNDYTLMYQDFNRTYVRAYYSSTGPVLQQGDATRVTVGASGLNMTPFQLLTAGTIKGAVTGTAGHLGWISISACPVGGGDCAWSSTDDSGGFTVDSLPPGTYTLNISDYSGYFPSGYYAAPGVLVPTADEATQITVPPSVAGLVVALAFAGSATAPNPPMGVTATAGNGAASVSWYPASDNGSPVTSYTATASDGSSCMTTTLSCTITGLTNGTSYTVAVTATNAIGTSDPSWMPVSVTPTGPVQTGVVKLAIAATSHTGVAGSPITVTVSALDRKGKPVKGYAGTVHFSSTDLRGGLPTDYTFTAADGGSHTFTVSMATAGAQAVTVSDGSLTTKRWAISVKAGPALSLVLTGPNSTTAGASQHYRVLAIDAYDNIATGCTDTMAVHSTDAATFKTAGLQAVSVDDYASNLLGYQDDIAVSPGKADSISISGLPGSTNSGVASNATVTVHDKFGNVATGYTSRVHFASNDRAAILPADYTFTAVDRGVHNFAITLTTKGNQWVTVRDTGKNSIGGMARVLVIPLK
jgi:protocatechuate 3,4-dioxygenase beta subunit